MNNRNYKIKYMVQVGDFPAREIPDGFGACDEMLICSIVRFPEGRGSIAWHSTKGQVDSEVSSSVAFNAWVSLAAKLSKTTDLNNRQRETLLNVVNAHTVERI